MAENTIKRYSEAFRIQVVREYEESGSSIYELHKRYNIGKTTIQKWITRYSKEGVRHRLMIIQSAEEQNHIKELEERIQQQEKLISRLALDKLMLESTLEVMERDYGIDVKKSASTSSKPPMKRKRSPK